MPTDLYLDPNSHDLVIETGTLRLTSDINEDAAQRLKIRLLIFKGEWILDNREGVPYYQSILKKTSKAAVDSIFKAKIQEEPLVDKITSFESTLSPSRYYELDFTVLLTTGDTLQQTFNIEV